MKMIRVALCVFCCAIVFDSFAMIKRPFVVRARYAQRARPEVLAKKIAAMQAQGRAIEYETPATQAVVRQKLAAAGAPVAAPPPVVPPPGVPGAAALPPARVGYAWKEVPVGARIVGPDEQLVPPPPPPPGVAMPEAQSGYRWEQIPQGARIVGPGEEMPPPGAPEPPPGGPELMPPPGGLMPPPDVGEAGTMAPPGAPVGGAAARARARAARTAAAAAARAAAAGGAEEEAGAAGEQAPPPERPAPRALNAQTLNALSDRENKASDRLFVEGIKQFAINFPGTGKLDEYLALLKRKNEEWDDVESLHDTVRMQEAFKKRAEFDRLFGQGRDGQGTFHALAQRLVKAVEAQGLQAAYDALSTFDQAGPVIALRAALGRLVFDPTVLETAVEHLLTIVINIVAGTRQLPDLVQTVRLASDRVAQGVMDQFNYGTDRFSGKYGADKVRQLFREIDLLRVHPVFLKADSLLSMKEMKAFKERSVVMGESKEQYKPVLMGVLGPNLRFVDFSRRNIEGRLSEQLFFLAPDKVFTEATVEVGQETELALNLRALRKELLAAQAQDPAEVLQEGLPRVTTIKGLKDLLVGMKNSIATSISNRIDRASVDDTLLALKRFAVLDSLPNEGLVRDLLTTHAKRAKVVGVLKRGFNLLKVATFPGAGPKFYRKLNDLIAAAIANASEEVRPVLEAARSELQGEFSGFRTAFTIIAWLEKYLSLTSQQKKSVIKAINPYGALLRVFEKISENVALAEQHGELIKNIEIFKTGNVSAGSLPDRLKLTHVIGAEVTVVSSPTESETHHLYKLSLMGARDLLFGLGISIKGFRAFVDELVKKGEVETENSEKYKVVMAGVAKAMAVKLFAMFVSIFDDLNKAKSTTTIQGTDYPIITGLECADFGGAKKVLCQRVFGEMRGKFGAALEMLGASNNHQVLRALDLADGSNFARAMAAAKQNIVQAIRTVPIGTAQDRAAFTDAVTSFIDDWVGRLKEARLALKEEFNDWWEEQVGEGEE